MGRKILEAGSFGWVLFLFLSACLPPSNILNPTSTFFPAALTPYISQTPAPPQTATPAQPQTLPTVTSTPQVYLVAADELGSEIALRFGITVAMLKAANPEVDLDFLKEGQQLIIPLRSETQMPLAFTPTPIQLAIQNPHCYPSADSGAWCLVEIENNQPDTLYYLSGDFSLESGGILRSANVSGLVDALPAGKSIPLITRFEPPVGYPFQIQFHLNSAFTAENPAVWPVEMKDIQIEIDTSGSFAQIKGLVFTGDRPISQVAVIGVAYQGNLPVGIRRIEIAREKEGLTEIPFDLTLYTVGVPMDRVELFAEGR